MRRLTTAVLATASLILLLASTAAMADNDVRDAWLARYPGACATLTSAVNSCGGCHQSGFALTPYGQDIADFGLAGSEGLDSDGDTRTNLQEINVCTLPWDGTSVPAEIPSWGMLKSLYR